MAWIAALAWFVTRGTVLLLAAGIGVPPTTGDAVSLVLTSLAYAVIVAGVAGLVLWRRVSWVRTSAGGLECADLGRNPVFLSWSAIESVALQRVGPFTELVVTPTASATQVVASPADRPPRWRRRAVRPAFVIDAGTLRPAPAALLAEITRRVSRHP
jgi:hypothetical protein